MINNVVLIGNLGRDPEVKYSASGTAIANFSICFKSGKDKTGWIKVVCFNKLAEIVGQHLSKGSKVGISGVLDENKWEDAQGNKKSMIQIICNNIEFIKTNNTNDNQQSTPGTAGGSGFDIPTGLPF